MLVGSANYNPEAAQLALDGNLATRWGSAAPQKPGMEYTITVLEPDLKLEGLVYQLGNFVHDKPTELSIELRLRDGTSRLVLTPDIYDDVIYYLDDNSRIPIRFAPTNVERIVLRELGSHPIFDWSIAELEIYASPVN
ncbi:MAG: hypothetical protein KDD53_02095 [Bdellovibrionales bacterium]|nr:hypothetical protein [Bdellovibrionales bacterium]